MKFLKKGIAILLISTVAFSSFGCHGNYAAFNKLNKFVGSLGDKWVNSIVHFIFLVVQIYTIAIFVDFLILNTVQFWTGSNPLSMNVGERETQVVNKDGVNYEITATRNRFDVFTMDGDKAGKFASLIYNENTMIWSAASGNEVIELVQIDSTDHGKMRSLIPGLEGKIIEVK